MRCYYLFISLFLSLPLFGQYQGIPMTGSNIKPNQIRWTRDIGTDSIFVMASDTITGKPYWFACKKSTLLSGGGGGTNTDGQQLSLLAGGGTLKLTQLTGASNFVQLKDSTITNEGILSMANPLSQVITISSNTSTSPTLTINGGAGLDLQYSAPTTFSITNTGDLSTTNEIQSLSLLSGGGTLKLTKGAGGGLSNFVQLRDSSITNELQTLSIFAGKGTIKLTNGASASTFIQLADSTITNEGKLTLTAPSGGIAYINSNTSTSASIGLNEGNGIALSSGGANIVTITNSKPNTDAQALSLLAGGGTLKLTKVGAVSDFVQLRDSSITNEGSLTVAAGTGTTSIINSNTSGSTPVTLTAGTGLTISEVGNVITYASTTTGTVTSVAATAPAAGFKITGSPITGAGTFVFDLSDDLAGLEAMSNTGFVVRTSTNTYANRSINAASSDITVTNGTGVIGNTSIDLATTAVVAGSYGASNSIPIYTVDSKGRLTASSQTTVLSQNLSRPLAGTLKLTNYSGASTFVNLPDSSQANEGLLTMSSGGTNTTQISSNTAGSNTQVIVVSGGLTSSIVGNTVTINGAGLSGVKHVRAASTDSGRGLLATMNTPKDTATIGLNYTGMATYNYLDTMDLIAYKDSSLAKNSKTQKKYVNYNAFIDVGQSTSNTYSLTAGVSSDVKLTDTGLSLCFSYNATTGEITYTGTIPKMFVISGHVSYKYSLINSANSLYLQLKPFGGAYGQIGIDAGNNTSTTQFYGLSVMKIINLSQGDKIKLQLKSDGTGTATVNNGYFNIFALSDNYNPN